MNVDDIVIADGQVKAEYRIPLHGFEEIGRDGMPIVDLKPRIPIAYRGCQVYYWPCGYER